MFCLFAQKFTISFFTYSFCFRNESNRVNILVSAWGKEKAAAQMVQPRGVRSEMHDWMELEKNIDILV